MSWRTIGQTNGWASGWADWTGATYGWRLGGRSNRQQKHERLVCGLADGWTRELASEWTGSEWDVDSDVHMDEQNYVRASAQWGFGADDPALFPHASNHPLAASDRLEESLGIDAK